VSVTAKSPVLSQYDPASQVAQLGAAVAPWYWPAGHEMQAACLNWSWYCPAAQNEHNAEPPAANDPVEQKEVTAESPWLPQ
jgi:hypothetical protein